jgi:prolipoprotein diacylglyceryltransferase
MRRSERFQGKIFWYYLLFYSVARFIIEIYRGDPRGWAIPEVLSIAQAIGIVAALLAIFMLFRKKAPPIRPRNIEGLSPNWPPRGKKPHTETAEIAERKI